MHRLKISAIAGALIWFLAPSASAGVCSEDCRPTIVRLPDTGDKTCYQFSATMAGTDKEVIERSRLALKETIEGFRHLQPAREGWMGRLETTPVKPALNPYMRSSVTRDLALGNFPSKEAYTVCWRGVVSPVVCTSGAKVCRKTTAARRP